MKDNPETKNALESAPKAYSFLQVAIPFVITMAFGTLATAVFGLFVYANVVDVKSRDTYFLIVSLVGLGVSLTAAYFAARRTLEIEKASTTGASFNLLKKYRRAATHVGSDAVAG